MTPKENLRAGLDTLRKLVDATEPPAEIRVAMIRGLVEHCQGLVDLVGEAPRRPRKLAGPEVGDA